MLWKEVLKQDSEGQVRSQISISEVIEEKSWNDALINEGFARCLPGLQLETATTSVPWHF